MKFRLNGVQDQRDQKNNKKDGKSANKKTQERKEGGDQNDIKVIA
jgi:hypothetical protein